MKRVWYLCMALLVIGLCSSCKDDLPGLGKDANRYFSGDDLILTYSGEPMYGKEVHFLTYDGKRATITLDGLLDSNTLFPSEDLHDMAFGGKERLTRLKELTIKITVSLLTKGKCRKIR